MSVLSSFSDPRSYIEPRLITEKILFENEISYDDLDLWYEDLSIECKLGLFKKMSIHHHMEIPEPTFYTSTMRTRDIDDVVSLWTTRHDVSRLSLYVHIPFCGPGKCSYCMYFSHVLSSLSVLDDYILLLASTFRHYSPAFEGKKFDTLYIGGGTPSVLSVDQFNTLFDHIEANFSLAPSGERTCEVSPESISRTKLETLRQRGINRVSMGVQSLIPDVLKKENRQFASLKRISRIANWVSELGFIDFNTDLMIGLRGDTGSGAFQSFKDLAKQKIPSITLYVRRTIPEIASTIMPSIGPGECVDVIKRISTIGPNYGYKDVVRNPTLECQHMVLSDHRLFEEEYITRYDSKSHNSCLGVGEGANSFIADEVYLECRRNSLDHELEFTIFKTSEKDRMRSFSVNRLYEVGFLGDLEFSRRFGMTLKDTFAREIAEVISLGIADYTADGFRLITEDPITRSVALKFFYRPSFLFERMLSGTSSEDRVGSE